MHQLSKKDFDLILWISELCVMEGNNSDDSKQQLVGTHKWSGSQRNGEAHKWHLRAAQCISSKRFRNHCVKWLLSRIYKMSLGCVLYRLCSFPCRFCEEEEETVEHLLCRCIAKENIRRYVLMNCTPDPSFFNNKNLFRLLNYINKLKV